MISIYNVIYLILIKHFLSLVGIIYSFGNKNLQTLLILIALTKLLHLKLDSHINC